MVRNLNTAKDTSLISHFRNDANYHFILPVLEILGQAVCVLLGRGFRFSTNSSKYTHLNTTTSALKASSFNSTGEKQKRKVVSVLTVH